MKEKSGYVCVCEREREFQVTCRRRGERHDWSGLTTEQECPNVDGIVREFHSSSTLLHSHSIRHVVVRGRGCISKRFQSNYLFNYRGYANMRFFLFFFPLRGASVGRFMSRVAHCTFAIFVPPYCYSTFLARYSTYTASITVLYFRVYTFQSANRENSE